MVGLTVILANVDCPFGERRTSQGTNVYAKLKVWQIRNIIFLDILSRGTWGPEDPLSSKDGRLQGSRSRCTIHNVNWHGPNAVALVAPK